MAWTTPRTWVPGELVTASMMNTHVRDNLNALRSSHFGVQKFRGLHLRTHEDPNSSQAVVQLVKADEIIMDDGTRIADWAGDLANISTSGASGLDTGSEANSTWYEIYAIATDAGSKGLLLHRSKNYFKDAEQVASTGDQPFRDAAARTQVSQGFKLGGTAGPIEVMEITLKKTGTPSGIVYLEIRADNAGVPAATVLATSRPLDVAGIPTTSTLCRFIFRTPFTPAAATQYHYVIIGTFTVSGTNYLNTSVTTANPYANGAYSAYDGATWTATAANDLVFRVYTTLNNAAVTMPASYTKKAKIGYVYNNSGGNFVPFVALDNEVTSYPIAQGAFTYTTPVLFDLSAVIPPGPMFLRVGVAHGTASSIVAVSGVPDGVAGVFNAATPTRSYVYTAVADSTLISGWLNVQTEFQTVYFNVLAGTGQFWVAGFRW